MSAMLPCRPPHTAKDFRFVVEGPRSRGLGSRMWESERERERERERGFTDVISIKEIQMDKKIKHEMDMGYQPAQVAFGLLLRHPGAFCC